MPIRSSKGLSFLTLVSKVVSPPIREPLLPLSTKRELSSIPKLIEGLSSKALSTMLRESLYSFTFFIEGLYLVLLLV